MKLLWLFESLLGDQTELKIEMRGTDSLFAAERMQSWLQDICGSMAFDLETYQGKWWLVISRKPGPVKVPYDA